jgi:hypothetical protein
MSFNFPDSPSLNQIYQQDGMSYEWTGSKWRRTDTSENSIVVEYSDIVEQTANTVSIEPDKYNYFKIDVDDNATITIPSASPYSSFVVELALGTTAYTVSWSNNVEWAGGSAPSYNYGYAAKVLLDFTTYDGTNWIGSELLDYEVFVYSFQGTVSGYSSGGSGVGQAKTNTIDKFSFSADANATDVGDLTVGRYGTAGQSSSSSGYNSGGYSITNIIDKFPFATDSNATDVGDLTLARLNAAGQSSDVSGYTSGGSGYTAIDKFPFAADANATDVGDTTEGQFNTAGQSSNQSGYISGGQPATNVINKFPFATDTNATDVGDLTLARISPAGQSSDVSGYTSAGWEGATRYNTVDKFPFSSDANATDVGDLTQGREGPAGQSSTASGYASGGRDSTPSRYTTIDKFPFSSDANATDVGDLTLARTSTGQQV